MGLARKPPKINDRKEGRIKPIQASLRSLILDVLAPSYLVLFMVFGIIWRLAALQAETVEIVSNMYTKEILADACFAKIRDAYEVRITDKKYHLPIISDGDSIKRYVIFNGHDNLTDLNSCSPAKKVLFMMEPECISYEEAQLFSRIYTWDDEVIDDKKFFKFYFPDLMPMIRELPPFEEKKLCTMVVRNWHAKHRGSIVEFFSTKPKGEFEFYGSPHSNLSYNRCYKGRIPGLNCGQEKIDILKNYRFCVCFENNTHLRGYISEKIFPCFAAGCVPVYWGAPNVEEYIPKDCFIDYRDFENTEELYLFLKGMPQETYERYLNGIRTFLNSDQAQLFSPEYFAQTLYEATTQ